MPKYRKTSLVVEAEGPADEPSDIVTFNGARLARDPHTPRARRRFWSEFDERPDLAPKTSVVAGDYNMIGY